MPAPKLPAMFSLFRHRGPRGFDMPTRFYDAEKEARAERAERIRKQQGISSEDRALFAERMRHSWQRKRSGTAQVQRLVFSIGLVTVVLYFIIKGFGLASF